MTTKTPDAVDYLGLPIPDTGEIDAALAELGEIASAAPSPCRCSIPLARLRSSTSSVSRP